MRAMTAGAAALAFLTTPAAVADTPPAAPPPAEKAPQLTVTRLVVHRPKAHRTIVRPLRIPARPTPSYVLGTIAPLEAARAGANLSVLTCRIRRESGGEFWAANGQFTGVGQFAPSTYARGLRTMPLRVQLRERSSRLVRAEVVRTWADGRVTRSKGRYSRVRLLTIRRAVLRPYGTPGNVSWAQVRIMAQAITGRSAVASSEWSTRSVCG